MLRRVIRLGVNIDHVATLRQARRESFPSVLAAAHAAEQGGADQITVHLRGDRRHIQERDVRRLHESIHTGLNLECAATDAMMAIALDVKPAALCLVPENREEITTEGGLDVEAHKEAVAKCVRAARDAHIPVSLFVDPQERALLAASEVGAHAVELHTGRYAGAREEGERIREYLALKDAAQAAKEMGLRVHAGHGLDYHNVSRIAALPDVEELNIGFAIVSRALFVGLEPAVRTMREEMLRARDGWGGAP